MSSKKNDEMVLKTIQQIIKEVKQEMQKEKVLVENKTPQVVFNQHEKDMKRYITENVMKALRDAEK